MLTRSETVHFDKITSRIEKLCYGLASEYLDIPAITLKVVEWKYCVCSVSFAAFFKGKQNRLDLDFNY